MTYSVWQSYITNGLTVLAGATVSVYHEGSGTPAALFSSPSGGSIGSSVTSDAAGLARFYVAAGVYRITVTHATFSAEHRHVRIGEMAGVDDAPSDGNMYARKDGDWEEVEDYTLPTASDSVLGGVKIGSDLAMGVGGVLSKSHNQITTTGGTVTPTATTDFIFGDLSSNLTLADPSGTPRDGHILTVFVYSTSSTRTITYGSAYISYSDLLVPRVFRGSYRTEPRILRFMWINSMSKYVLQLSNALQATTNYLGFNSSMESYGSLIDIVVNSIRLFTSGYTAGFGSDLSLGTQTYGNYAVAIGSNVGPSAYAGFAIDIGQCLGSKTAYPTESIFIGKRDASSVTAPFIVNSVVISKLPTLAENSSVDSAHRLSVSIGHEIYAGSRGVTIGYQAKSGGNYDGLYNVAVGYGAGKAWTAANNTAIGYKCLDASTMSWTNTTGLGYNAQVTGSNQLQLGDTSTAVYSQSAVNVRSDVRDKADIRDTELGLDFILGLRPVQYRLDPRDRYRPVAPESNLPAYTEPVVEEGEEPFTQEELDAHRKDWEEKVFAPAKEADQLAQEAWSESCRLANIAHDGTHKGSRFHNGFIAHEVKELADSLGKDFAGYQDHSINGGEDVKSLGYEQFIAPMVKAIQELTARIEELENK